MTPTTAAVPAESTPAGSTRSRITAAAVELWFERGYHGASLRDIARVVGVQMSTLYHYHPSKQSLLVELMSTTMDELVDKVTAAVADATTTQARLEAVVRAHVLYHAERSKEMFIADSELRSLEPLGRELVISKRDTYGKVFAQLYETGCQQGDFVVRDVSVTSSAIFGMISSVSLWYRPNGRLTLDAVADCIADLVIRGIGSAPAGRPVAHRN